MRRLRSLALAVACLALGACHGVQTTLDPAARQAADIDNIWRLMLWVCGLMYLAVMAFLAAALWRAHKRRRRLESTPQLGPTPADAGLEKTLTGWAGVIVAGLILLTTASFLVDRSLAEVGPKPLQIRVTANQWWWQVDYQGDQPEDHIRTANELHLPLGRPAVLTLVANDVIHSFWVPNLSGKTDLIPGRENYMPVTPTRTGVFRGQCAEFCGLEHAKMAFDVTVESPAAFAAWKQAQSTTPPTPADPALQHGQQVLTTKACVMCHAVQGTGANASVGPDLTHFASRAHLAAGARPNTRGDLMAWIADPQAVKPGTTMPRVPLTSQELNDVALYLESLK